MTPLTLGLLYGWAALTITPAIVAPLYAKISKGSIRTPKDDSLP